MVTISTSAEVVILANSVGPAIFDFGVLALPHDDHPVGDFAFAIKFAIPRRIRN